MSYVTCCAVNEKCPVFPHGLVEKQDRNIETETDTKTGHFQKYHISASRNDTPGD